VGREKDAQNLSLRAAAWDVVSALSDARRKEGLDWSAELEKAYQCSTKLEELLLTNLGEEK